MIKRSKYRFNKQIKSSLDTKQCIQEIVISNVWNTHIVQILREKRDGGFIFNGNILNILTKSVRLSHDWIKTNFKYQEPEVYAIFLMSQKKDPLNSLLDVQIHTEKSVPDALKLYVLQVNNSACVFCSLSYAFYFIGDKIAADRCYKDEIISSLKLNDRIIFSQDVTLINVREMGKPRCKILCKVLKKEYGYYTLLYIYPYT